MAADFTYDGSKIVACNGTSGTPKTFADMHDADMAGTFELLAAWSPDNNTKALTNQVQPAESKGLKIDFVVASKTTEADYIFVTGTDIDGNAQTESLDVSAGDGTYTTTKWFATITNIDCSDNAAGGGTVWADGTVQVVQNRWGVIWELVEDGQYKIDCNIDFGDGSTSSYFQSTQEMVYVAGDPKIKTNATLKLGDVYGSWGVNGSFWTLALNTDQVHFLDGGSFYLYGSTLYNPTANRVYFNTGDISILNSTFMGAFYDDSLAYTNSFRLEAGLSSVNISKLYVNDLYGFYLMKAPTTLSDVHIHRAKRAIITNQPITCDGVRLSSITDEDIHNYAVGATTITMTNPSVLIGSVRIDYAPASIVESFTCNIHMSDKNGANLASVNIECIETGGSQVFSVATDANGDIAEQTIDFKKWEGTDETLTEYSPHKFILTKPGYKTLILDNITVDAPIVWELEMPEAVGAFAEAWR